MSALNFIVDKDKCIHCGLCESDCGAKIISLNSDKFPEIKPEYEKYCMECQHCFAICPTGAISICGKNPQKSDDCTNLPSEEQMLNLIKHRKSIRSYQHRNLDKDILQKLKNMLKYSPTGCNNHKLHVAFIDDVEVMDQFRKRANNILKRMFLAKKLSTITKKFPRHKKEHEDKRDGIFRNAPHMVVISVPANAPGASADPIILLSYFELYAQSLGVGTLWCGLAAIFLKLVPELCEFLEIPKGYKVGYVMLFGPTDLKYQRTTQPKDYQVISVQPKNEVKLSVLTKIKRFFWNNMR